MLGLSQETWRWLSVFIEPEYQYSGVWLDPGEDKVELY